MGPYYLTALINLLGPAKYVTSICNHNTKKRIIGIGPKKGKKLKLNALLLIFRQLNFKMEQRSD